MSILILSAVGGGGIQIANSMLFLLLHRDRARCNFVFNRCGNDATLTNPLERTTCKIRKQIFLWHLPYLRPKTMETTYLSLHLHLHRWVDDRFSLAYQPGMWPAFDISTNLINGGSYQPAIRAAFEGTNHLNGGSYQPANDVPTSITEACINQQLGRRSKVPTSFTVNPLNNVRPVSLIRQYRSVF